MKRLSIKFLVLITMLIGFPAAGILLTGQSLDPYIEFPPDTHFIEKAPFSWGVFAFFLVLILITLMILSSLIGKAVRQSIPQPAVKRFPWWGWLAVACLAVFWTIAWNRFEWTASFQEHTFFPLWGCYIVIINALTYRRSGRCMLTERPVFFVSLFPVSAFFWWFFEYLNRFVQNWHYTGTQYGPFQYFLLASLAFSTVLPAVLGTMDYLLSFSWLKEKLKLERRPSFHHPEILGWAGIVLASATLLLLGVLPDILFPLLWVSPLIVIVSLKTLFGESHLLHLDNEDNQRRVVAAMLAALICGVFWEMWNYWSLVKWYYSIPFVERFRLFEMPILGYSGYLPFGVECAVIGNAVAGVLKR